MTELLLRNNKLSGSLVINRLPQWMDEIDVRINRFSAVTVIESETDATIKLEGSGVTSILDENGRELDIRMFLD